MPKNTVVEDILLREAEEHLGETDFNNPREVETSFNKIALLIAGIDDLIRVDYYINKISKQYTAVSKPALRKLVTQKQAQLKLEEEQHAAELLVKEQEEKNRIRSIEQYINTKKISGVEWKADQLLSNVTGPVERNASFETIAHMIALIDKPVVREDYAKTIGKKYDLQPAVLKKMITDALEVRKRQREIKKTVRKNQVLTLQGNASVYPFFDEVVTKKGEFDKIVINKVKFVELLGSFGFSRFEVGENDNYTFVHVQGNIIKNVTADDIIDHLEKFINKEYNFENNPNVEHTNAEMLLNKFYDGINNYFNKKLFARVRLQNDIIINRDKLDTTYLYYSNGFLEINKEGFTLRPYDEMEGSIWNHQMLNREYQPIEPGQLNQGDFYKFCWLVCGERDDRFHSLCTIIGYLMHDFYEYELKSVLFTDSTISENAMGRTGKGIIFEMLGHVRSLCDIDGKEFDSNDKHKYEDLKLGTQIVHFNDIKHRGRNAFDFENLFNTITKGLKVNIKYVEPFLQKSKIGITTNKTLNIMGDSQEARIVEFEMAPFFSKNYTPAMHFKKWFGRDWDTLEWNRFDSFMSFCASMFHAKGIIKPPTINLEARRLRDYVGMEFIEFIDDIALNLKNSGIPWPGYIVSGTPDFTKFELQDFALDKGQLYARFIHEYPDFKSWLKQKKFTSYLIHYSKVKMNVEEPKQWKSNGAQFIQFVNDKK